MAAIHIVRFHLNPDVDEKDFHTVNGLFQQEAMAILPGLERRESARGSDGEWVLVLRYRDLASAKQQGSPSEVGKKLMGMIDKKTLSGAVYEVATD